MIRRDSVPGWLALTLGFVALIGCAQPTSRSDTEVVRVSVHEQKHPMKGHPTLVRARLVPAADVINLPSEQSSILHVELFEGLDLDVRVNARELRRGLTMYTVLDSGHAATTGTLFVSRSGVSGNISIGRSVFELQAAPGGHVWILELDPSRLEYGESTIPRPEPPTPDLPDVEIPSRESLQILREYATYITTVRTHSQPEPPIIDVMLVFPENGTDETDDDLRDRIVQDVNNAFRNLAKIRIVHTMHVDRPSECPAECASEDGCTYCERFCMYDELAWVANDPTVAAARENHKADVVAMIIDTSILSGTSWTLGIESAQDQETARKYAFMVVNRSHAVSVHTFAHELGHVLGLRHERGAYFSTSHTLCNYASMVRDPSGNSVGCTIMHTSAGGDCTSRYPVYSAPKGATIEVQENAPPVVVGTMDDDPSLEYGKACVTSEPGVTDGLFGYHYIYMTAPFVSGYYDD